MSNYKSKHTGAQVDEAVSKVLNGDIEGSNIKDGSVPLSALDDNIKNEIGYVGTLSVESPVLTLPTLFMVYYVDGNLIQPYTTITLYGTLQIQYVISNNVAKLIVDYDNSGYKGNLKVTRNRNIKSYELPTTIADWNAKEGEAGYIENKPFGLGDIKLIDEKECFDSTEFIKFDRSDKSIKLIKSHITNEEHDISVDVEFMINLFTGEYNIIKDYNDASRFYFDFIFEHCTEDPTFDNFISWGLFDNFETDFIPCTITSKIYEIDIKKLANNFISDNFVKNSSYEFKWEWILSQNKIITNISTDDVYKYLFLIQGSKGDLVTLHLSECEFDNSVYGETNFLFFVENDNKHNIFLKGIDNEYSIKIDLESEDDDYSSIIETYTSKVNPIINKYVCNPIVLQDEAIIPLELIDNGKFKYRNPNMFTHFFVDYIEWIDGEDENGNDIMAGKDTCLCLKSIKEDYIELFDLDNFKDTWRLYLYEYEGEYYLQKDW